MEAKALDDNEFSLIIQALTTAFLRLKGSHSFAEALLVARTVITSVYSTDSSPSRAPPAPASQPPPPSTPQSSKKNAKKRARRSAAAQAVANARRAEYLRAQANGLDPKSADSSVMPNKGAERASASEQHVANAHSPPSTPTKQTVVEQHEQAGALTSSGSSEHAKRSREATPPVKLPGTPTSAPPDAKRVYGSAPKQLVFGFSDIEIQDSTAPLELLPPLDSLRADVLAFIEASTLWRQLIHEGHVVVLERVISKMSKELQKVDKEAWGKHMKERLGKVAGYECNVSRVRLQVPKG